MNAFPHPWRDAGRLSPAHGAHLTLAEPNIFWTTVCAKNRGQWISQQNVQSILERIWHKPSNFWLVGDYLLMPDHLHFFCAPLKFDVPIERWMAFWKDTFTKSHPQEDWKWQRGAFHHRIRSREEFTEKWTYMMENPMRKGFAKDINEWPWKGKINSIGWP